jgi:hypothetical protein
MLSASGWVPAAQAAGLQPAPEIARLHPGAEVDVMLVLAVDASQSMDEAEQRIQRRGYVEALTSPEVIEAIALGPNGRIAVTYFEWGSAERQTLVAPWQIIDGKAAASAFARQIEAAPLQNLERTAIGAALTYAERLFRQPDLVAGRKVIDISGDGPNNDGPVATLARDRLVADGVTINGLPIISGSVDESFWNRTKLDTYYEGCVIGGAGSFAIPVNGFENFAKALKMKLVIEIAGIAVPAPDAFTVLPAAGAAELPDCRTVP